MKISCGALLVLLLSPLALADRLPTLDDKPWLGCYLGYVGRGYDFAFGTDGKSEIHWKEGKNRTAAHSYFSVSYVLEEKIGEKWVRRTLSDDGFAFTHEASTEKDESTVGMTYTGDTKVALTHEFDKGEIVIRGKIVEKKTENPLRFGVAVSVPYIWKSYNAEEELSERDLKDKIKDAEIRAVRAVDGKRAKYEFWEDVQLGDDDQLGGGVEELMVEAKKFEGRRTTFSVGNLEQGAIMVNHRGPLYSGFKLEWIPGVEHLGKEDCFFKIEIK